MSTSIQFYLRVCDEFAPIGSFTASSKQYKIAQDAAPHGSIAPVSETQLKTFIAKARNGILDNGDRLDQLLEQEEVIYTKMAAPITEKMEYIEKYISPYVEEADQAISEYTAALNYFRALLEIIQTVEYHAFISINRYLYVGIECAYPETTDVKDS